MTPAPAVLAFIIDGSAAAVALLVRAALRGLRSAPPRGDPRCARPSVVPPPAGAVPDGEAAGLAAVIAGVVTGLGITAGLWICGQDRTASWALVLAAAAVLVAGAGYVGGLRDRRPSAPSWAGQPPSEQDTADLGAQLLAQMYGQPSGPEPPRPRRDGPPGPGPGTG